MIVLPLVQHLVERGFALHWLRPRSKAPFEDGWSEKPVYSVDDLRRQYRDGFNTGLRLGEPSRVAGLYLHVIDVDIRIAEEAPYALAKLTELFPDHVRWPAVISGSGGASRHFYLLTDKPFASKKLATSKGKHCRERRDPKTGEIKQAWSYDWEIELFGSGKQVVIPPSIHPDTGKPYVWEREFDFDLIDLGGGPFMPSSAIEALGAAELATYDFETREPLDFKPGQLEAELDLIPVSDLDYDDWIRLGQALHHQFGGSEEGFDLWLKHTRRSKKFTGDDQVREMRRTKWRSFGRYRGVPVTMGTVRVWAQQARNAELLESFEEEDETDDFADDDEEDLIGPAPAAEDEKDPIDAIGDPSAKRQDLEWTSRLDRNDEGAVKPTLHNAALIIAHDPRTAGIPRLNQFTCEVVQRGVPGRRPGKTEKGILQLDSPVWVLKDEVNGDLWVDPMDNAVRQVIEAPKQQGGYGIKLSDRDLRAAVDLAAQRNPFHPIREFLEAQAWDGVERVERLFIDYLGAEDTAYTRQVARMFLTAAVARVFEPGHKFDFAPILEGLQGKRKSTFIAVLGKSWSTELEGDFHDAKQMVETMQGAWILEIPELSVMSRADVRTIKAFMSRCTDKVRLAYARRAQEFPRQCVFIGSTNDREYLRDQTGGRRFWPIQCEVATIDTGRLEREVDQIWAEAFTSYQAMRAAQPTGTLPLYLSGEAAIIAVAEQELRRVETPEDGIAGQIQAWADEPLRTEFEDDDDLVGSPPRFRDRIWLRLIWEDCLGRDPERYGTQATNMLSSAMQRVSGWKMLSTPRRTNYKNHGNQRVYVRINPDHSTNS